MGRALCTLTPALCDSWGGMCRQCCEKDLLYPTAHENGCYRVHVFVFPCMCTVCVRSLQRVRTNTRTGHKCRKLKEKKRKEERKKKGKENVNIWSIDSCFNLSQQPGSRGKLPLHNHIHISFACSGFPPGVLSGSALYKLCCSTYCTVPKQQQVFTINLAHKWSDIIHKDAVTKI